MSDDTPTQRYPEGFPPVGGSQPSGSDATPPASTHAADPSISPTADAPTERFAAAGNEPPAGTVPLADTVPPGANVPPAAPQASGSGDRRTQRGLIIGLAIAAGVLLLTLIGVLIWLAVNAGSPSVAPTESSTPSETPSESPEPSPTPTETETTPPPPPPAPESAIQSYTASTPQVDCTAAGGTSVPVTFSWAATGTMLWFGVGTDNAKADPYDDYPLNYTMDFDYQCGQPGSQQRYTITVERNDGTLESQTLIIRES